MSEHKRKSVSKRLRFEIFARDNFTCRYCGRQSDQVQLHVDHVVPVCNGGGNEPENLITSCAPCNLGKSGKTISQHVPSESDRLRLAQERNEQISALEKAKEAISARAEIRQQFINAWCEITGRDEVHKQTLNIVFSYVSQFGFDAVLGWIETAVSRGCHKDINIGRYVSGIRRAVLAESGELHNA